MVRKWTLRRRWFGGTTLAIAAGMLVMGESLLKGRLTDLNFMLYWLICFTLTLIAIVIAFLDLHFVQRETRREHHELLRNAINEIEHEARVRGTKPTSPQQVRSWRN